MAPGEGGLTTRPPSPSLHTQGPWDHEQNSCPCGCWNRSQHEWFALLDRLGDEAAARAEVVRHLRQAADLIERGGYPDVFGCILPVGEKPCEGGRFIEEVSVTLSNPWPG